MAWTTNNAPTLRIGSCRRKPKNCNRQWRKPRSPHAMHSLLKSVALTSGVQDTPSPMEVFRKRAEEWQRLGTSVGYPPSCCSLAGVACAVEWQQ